jgi:hypothetical protein
MNPEAQRIAIAEWCGWVFVKDNPLKGWRKEHLAFTKPGAHAVAENIPDYLNDLNAMHEAQNKLQDADFGKFVSLLKGEYLERTRGLTSDGCISATAAQRAEALLRTIGKWKDE